MVCMDTPLHIAIQNGNTDIVRMLLTKECDLGVRNADGLTPLGLAMKMKNDAIVRLLLEQDAKHTGITRPTATMLASTRKHRRRINFWTGFLVLTTGAVIFLTIIHELFAIVAQFDARVVEGIDSLYFPCIYLPCLTAYLGCYVFYLRRLWETIPEKIARTTPKRAANFSLIPIFNWYWMFIALGGLYRDMNKAMKSYGHAKRFNASGIFIVCAIWLLCDFVSIAWGFITGMVLVEFFPHAAPFMILSSFLFIISAGLWAIFTCIMYGIIRKDVLKFMDIESRKK